MHDEQRTILPWPQVRTTVLGDHRIFSLTRTVRRKPGSDVEHTFFGLEASDWVNVIALTDAGQIVLVEQYRHGTDAITLEIPGGVVDPGEEPKTAGIRELEEETGFICRRCELLGWVEPSPAFLNNRCWTFLALGCRASGTVSFDPAEDILVRLVTVRGFTALIDSGDIRHALVIAAHDHLQRGLASGAAWASEVSG